MTVENQESKFYFKMGILLLALILAGFGSASVIRGISPLELPLLFHLHGIAYLLWYSLFIIQTRLILTNKYITHKRLGYSSLLIVLFMLSTAFLMAAGSYDRNISPIPDMTVQQFLSFPMMDLLGLVLFYTIGILNRNSPLTHKHAMLILCIALMDPALARLAISIGFPPLMVILHLGLVVLVMLYDRKTEGKIHIITWLGLGYIITRTAFIMTIGRTESWANFMNGIFG